MTATTNEYTPGSVVGLCEHSARRLTEEGHIRCQDCGAEFSWENGAAVQARYGHGHGTTLSAVPMPETDALRIALATEIAYLRAALRAIDEAPAFTVEAAYQMQDIAQDALEGTWEGGQNDINPT